MNRQDWMTRAVITAFFALILRQNEAVMTTSSVKSTSSAMTSVFGTFDVLRNKRLSDPFEVIRNVDDFSTCEQYCVQKLCESFAHSTFEKTCQLYDHPPGTPAIFHNNYVLYVKTKGEEDGFYVFQNTYVKLMLQLKRFGQAQETCESIHGSLVTVESMKKNDLLLRLMTSHNVWEAFLGLTDEQEEGQWRTVDGAASSSFENWSYKGMWERRDKNCGLITISGEWKHENCDFPHYFFCQVQMY